MDDVLDTNIKDSDQPNGLDSTSSDAGTMETGPRTSESNSSDNPFPTADELLATLRKRQQAAGRAGGLSRSSAKREATKRNIAKARLSRWPGREQAAKAASVASLGEGEIKCPEE